MSERERKRERKGGARVAWALLVYGVLNLI